MHTVWKFPLSIIDNQLVKMPTGSRLLSVQLQQGEPMLWAIVEETAQSIDRHIKIIGTGHRANHVLDDAFVGTIQIGSLVFHVFDAGEQ